MYADSKEFEINYFTATLGLASYCIDTIFFLNKIIISAADVGPTKKRRT